MKKLKCSFAIMMAVLFFSLPLMVHAQDPGDNPDAPLDGGVSILIAAGVGYGAKKMQEARKRRNKDR
jgi:hypothetical protein